MIDGFGQHIDTQHHPRTTAGRRIIHGAVLVGSEVADLDGIDGPLALGHGAACEAYAEGAGEHFRVEREDGGVEGHGRAT